MSGPKQAQKTCIGCFQVKYLKEFPMTKSRNKIYYRSRCFDCYKKYKNSLPKSTASADLYGDTIPCIRCKYEKDKSEFYFDSSTGYVHKKCKSCFAETNLSRDRSRNLRLRCIETYGGLCNCCGEDKEIFLTFDHINDDGATQREKIRSGYSFYKWLRDEDRSDVIQILCYNCNWAKYRGGCPHQETA